MEDLTYKMEGLIILGFCGVFWVHRSTAVPATLTVLYIDARRSMYGLFTYIKFLITKGYLGKYLRPNI